MFVTRGAALDTAAPEPYAKAAKAALAAARKSYEAFRAVDQAEHERLWKQHHDAAVARAEKAVSVWCLDVGEVEPDTAAARDAARAAEDRARDAREYARTQQAEAERIRESGTAADATDATVRADTADGVASEREAAAVTAREHLEGLEKDLQEARDALEAAERDLRAARKAAEVTAGEAPYSETTLQFCSAFMQTSEVWDGLSDRDKRRVRDAGEPRDMLSPQESQAWMREILSGTAV